jgi:hypothetical protein
VVGTTIEKIRKWERVDETEALTDLFNRAARLVTEIFWSARHSDPFCALYDTNFFHSKNGYFLIDPIFLSVFISTDVQPTR